MCCSIGVIKINILCLLIKINIVFFQLLLYYRSKTWILIILNIFNGDTRSLTYFQIPRKNSVSSFLQAETKLHHWNCAHCEEAFTSTLEINVLIDKSMVVIELVGWHFERNLLMLSNIKTWLFQLLYK